MPEIIVPGYKGPRWRSHCSECGCVADWTKEEVEGMEKCPEDFPRPLRYKANCPSCDKPVVVRFPLL